MDLIIYDHGDKRIGIPGWAFRSPSFSTSQCMTLSKFLPLLASVRFPVNYSASAQKLWVLWRASEVKVRGRWEEKNQEADGLRVSIAGVHSYILCVQSLHKISLKKGFRCL